jgi:hypothetical protein
VATKRALGRTHHVHVERQPQIEARHGLLADGSLTDALDLIELLAADVDDHAQLTILAAQVALPGALDPAPADRLARTVAEPSEALQVVRADLVEEAQRVRAERLERVRAHRRREHVDAGQVAPVRLDRRVLVARDVVERLDVVQAPPLRDLLHPLTEALLLVGIELEQVRDRVQLLFRDQLGRDEHVVGGPVLRDHAPLMVAYDAAGRREPNHLRDVLLGLGLPLRGLE